MARRTPPTDPNQLPEAAPVGGLPNVPAPSLPGGAMGVPEASKVIHFGTPLHDSPTVAQDPDFEPPKVSRYEVIDCPKPTTGTHGYKVVNNGCLAFLADGKIIDTNNYDVESLKKQGVKLRHVGDF